DSAVTELTPSINEWEAIIYKGGYVGANGVSINDIDVLITKPSDLEPTALEELDLDTALRYDILGYDGDCTIDSISDACLFAGISGQTIKIKLSNLSSMAAKPTLIVESPLVGGSISLTCSIPGNSDAIQSVYAEAPVIDGITEGSYPVSCRLICESGLEESQNGIVEVIADPKDVFESGDVENIDGTLTWISRDPEIADVVDGKLVCKKEGSTIIDGYIGDIFVISYPVKVEPNEDDEPAVPDKPEAVILPQGKLNLQTGETRKITVQIFPYGVICQNISFVSEDPEIASVDKEGNVTGLKAGETKITVTADDSVSSQISIKVEKKDETPDIPDKPQNDSPASLAFKENSVTIPVGAAWKLEYDIDPESGKYDISFASSDPGIVTVTEDGNITGMTEGTATVTLTVNDKTASCTVTVLQLGEVTSLKAITEGMNKVTVSWDEIENADGCIILRNGKQIGYSLENSFEDTEADADTWNYYWALPFVKSGGLVLTGKLSNYVWALGRKISTIENVTAKEEKGSVKLEWTAAEGANGYVILSKSGSDKVPFNEPVYVDSTSAAIPSGSGVHFFWVYGIYKNAEGKIIAAGKVSPYAWAVVK
ncbi:MAG: Ig-like domain-containing protein, partial [Parasporobacterium sp.]|nr:Ig-like domain-containing protein [Parasporobacterium sp.]